MKANVTLIKKEAIADGTTAFHFSKPQGFEFQAGQFAEYTLIDPPETDAEGNTRAFSLVHAPFEPNLVAATRMRDTAFKRVLKNMPVGSEIEFDGPYGDFALHTEASTPAVFIVGGIGVTPVRSMIVQASRNITGPRITLLHSSHTPSLMPFRNDFERLARENRSFRYFMTVDEPTEYWGGESGRVNAEMVKRHFPDLFKPIYYLCGPGGMVKSMRKLLMDLNVDEENIRTEEFTGY